jgi:hypothetical protein
LTGSVRVSYILAMTDGATRFISFLTKHRDKARARYFAHVDPGGLTASEQNAFAYEHLALELLLKAAQCRLDTEIELQRGLEAERAA